MKLPFNFGRSEKKAQQQSFRTTNQSYAPLFFPSGKKAYVPTSPYASLIDLMTFSGSTALAAWQCIQYYLRCAPLATANDTIGQSLAQIKPLIYDENKEQFIKKHPLLDLLKLPNADITYSGFIFATYTYYNLTGNAYLIATGNVNKPALELMAIRPQMVSITMGKDGYADLYQINAFWGSLIFTRHEVNGRFRYFNATMDQELYHIRNINPFSTSQMVYGLSPLNSLFYDIEQFINASVHNLALLKNGAFPNGFFESEEPLSDEQFIKLEAEARAIYTGANNAGRTGILEDGIKFKPTTISNREMDFAALKKDVMINIYNKLRIPLPLISPDTMTLANMETAKLGLYDDAVLPMLDRLFQELTYFLMPRFKNSENLCLSYDEKDILALEPRHNSQMKFKKDLGIYTLNELRDQVGAERIAGGNVVYVPGMVKQIAIDEEDPNDMPEDMKEIAVTPQKTETGKITESEQTPVAPTKTITRGQKHADYVPETPITDKDEYIRLMQLQKEKDGIRRYSDQEIDEYVKEFYGE